MKIRILLGVLILFLALVASHDYSAHDTPPCDVAELVEASKSVIAHIDYLPMEVTHSIYVSPAQQLRNEADEIEAKDAAVWRLKTAIKECAWMKGEEK